MIEGKVINLVALEPDDIDILYKWENDTTIWPVSGTSSPFSKYTLNEYLKTANDDIYTTKQLRFVIQKKDGGEKLGFVDLFEFDPLNLKAGVGILIGEGEHRNKGYATEALQLIELYAFSSLHLHQLYCHIQSNNKGSIKLFEKAGYNKVGELKDWVNESGTFRDVYFYQRIDPKIE